MRKYVVKDILDTAIKYQDNNVVEHLFLPISIYIFMAKEIVIKKYLQPM
ncbi:MAG: hypothetical protein O7D30_04600 [Rickettsia endosymbiont of Ixodes persulcatus]|nr:hypothetical protein [Rickettsia endosymbiont of Ixodes persulcatus]